MQLVTLLAAHIVVGDLDDMRRLNGSNTQWNAAPERCRNNSNIGLPPTGSVPDSDTAAPVPALTKAHDTDDGTLQVIGACVSDNDIGVQVAAVADTDDSDMDVSVSDTAAHVPACHVSDIGAHIPTCHHSDTAAHVSACHVSDIGVHIPACHRSDSDVIIYV
jgi:hypothetical protein